ncbi:MAG: hypothetical protein RIR48_3538 [Bacteroidota bacterium]
MAFMRILLILASCFIFACSDSKKVILKNDTGTVVQEYYLAHDSIKHGSFKSYFENGKIKELCTYDQGILTGTRIIYYPNGQIEISETYDANGNLHGPYRQFFENGNLKVEKNYTENVLNGNMKIFYPDGKIKEDVTMVNNEENGPFLEYYQNGKIHWKGNYRNGDHEYGILYQFDSIGNLVKIMKCDTMAICSTVWKYGMAQINTDTIHYE